MQMKDTGKERAMNKWPKTVLENLCRDDYLKLCGISWEVQLFSKLEKSDSASLYSDIQIMKTLMI